MVLSAACLFANGKRRQSKRCDRKKCGYTGGKSASTRTHSALSISSNEEIAKRNEKKIVFFKKIVIEEVITSLNTVE